MARGDWTLGRAARIAGYLLLGAAGTIAVAIAVLNLGRPVQPLVSDLLYLQRGPSEATTAAVLVHFLLAALVGLAVVTLVAERLSTGGEYRRAVAWATVALGVVLLSFLLAAWFGLAAFLTALVVLGAPVSPSRSRCGAASTCARARSPRSPATSQSWYSCSSSPGSASAGAGGTS